MQENMNSAAVENNSAETGAENKTETQAPAETSKGAKTSKSKRRAAAKQKNDTSKIRKRRYSTIAVKSKRHVLVVIDKKGAETFATGRNELSRAAKINAVLLNAGRPLTLAQIREKLDSLYGADHVKALSNHMRALLVKGAATLKDGAYSLKTKKAPAPVADKGAESEGAQS